MSRDDNAALSADAIEITRWALLARDYAERTEFMERRNE